jgi:ectoine hydroxylase-related dioxygenase (phytanoyl-CoA dioxygenase family)
MDDECRAGAVDPRRGGEAEQMVVYVAADANDLLAEVTRGLTQDGVVVIDEVLDAHVVTRAKEALERGAAADEARGRVVRGSAYDPDDLNLRVGNLSGKDAVFRALLDLPVVQASVTAWLGDSVRLSNFSSNTTLPGAGAMALHADQNNIPAPWPPYPCSLNLGFVLDEFTERNATRYMPGSHQESGPPAWQGAHPDAVAVAAQAGSLILMDGRLHHQTGPNTGTTSRAAAFAYFIRSFLAPQFELRRGIPRELQAELSPWLREILGFGPSGGVVEFIPKDDVSQPEAAR